MHRNTIRLAVAVLGAALSPLGAQAPAKQEALPKAEALLDKYVEATGGKAAYEKLRNQVRTGSLTISAQGITAKMTIYRAAPDKSLAVVDIPGIGVAEEGFDGKVAWSRSPMQGPRIKEGDERAIAAMAANFHGETRWRDLIKSAETVGSEEVDGAPCYKVAVTTKDGLQQTRWYDRKSGLLVRTSMTMKTAMGEIPVEATVSDYRAVDGVMTPHRIVQKAMGQEIALTFDSVKNNVEIEPSRFDLPEEIKALQSKGK